MLESRLRGMGKVERDTQGGFAGSQIVKGLDILRDMKSLKTIGVGYLSTQAWPAAEFWARYDKGEFKK